MLLFAIISSPDENEHNSKDKRLRIESYIAKTAEGDTAALAELYEETKGAVYGFALSVLKNTHDAEDVLQDTYIRIYNSAHTYTPRGNPMAWIIEIAKNLSYTILRKNSRAEFVPQEELENAGTDDFSDTVTENLTVTDAMLTLSESERQIIALHALSGLKHREIARILDLPISTVLSKYNRSVKKLQKMLEG